MAVIGTFETCRRLLGMSAYRGTVYPTNPPRVDYELTERGKTLIVPLHLLWTWAQANRTAIEGARRDFDQDRNR
jgi:DNA-binding HxlR family transcriptional regulator